MIFRLSHQICIIYLLVFCIFSTSSLKVSSYTSINRLSHVQSEIYAKGKMPIFDENDENELENLLSNYQAKPKRPTTQATKSQYSPPSVNNKASTQSSSLPPLVKPNPDWRTAKSDYNPYQTEQNNRKKPVVVEEHDDYFSFTDLDYDDFEAAMREVEYGGMGVIGGGDKSSDIPPEIQNGLESGDIIKSTLWSYLACTDDSICELSKLLKPESDLLFIYVDPRRMTEEYKMILRQLAQVPIIPLKLSLTAINCDDNSDIRKFLKKANFPTSSFSLLTDKTKKFMEALKCRSEGRIASALILYQPSTTKILKVWYEGSWDVMETKDLIVEEVNMFRRNPKQYIESQIGIR